MEMVPSGGQLAWMMTGALVGFVTYCNLPSAWIFPVEKATASWLKEANVRPASANNAALVKAGDLWKDSAGELCN